MAQKISLSKSRSGNKKTISLAFGAVAAFTVGSAQVSPAQTNSGPSTSGPAPINNPASNFATQSRGGVPNQHQNVFATRTQQPQLNSFEDWLWNSPTMTGNWGGLRTKLKNEGINIFANYISQVGHVASGGKAPGTDYTQQVTFGIDWDLQKLLGWKGGLFHTYIESRAGRNLEGDYVGSNIQPDSTYGAGENFRLLNLSLEQKLNHNSVDLLAGFYPISTEFAYNPLLSSVGFLANVYSTHPQTLVSDTGYQSGPVAQWGGRIKYFPTPNTYAMIGAWDVNPAYSPSDNHGWDLSFEGSTGAEVPIEFGYISSFGPGALVGHYKIGGLYDTTETKDVEYPAINRYGRYAGWIMVDQQVWKPSPKSTRNLMVFGEFSLADKRTAPEDYIWNVGFSFEGLIPQRPLDNFNVGFARADTNPRAITAANEAACGKGNCDPGIQNAQEDLEIGYNIQATKWLALTPDFQYLWGVSSTRTLPHYDNATVISLQTRIAF